MNVWTGRGFRYAFLSAVLASGPLPLLGAQLTEPDRGAAGDAAHLDYARVNGVQIAYRLEGAGFPVVFVHGESLSHELWSGQLDRFRQNYLFLSYDRRGHGQSEAPASGYSPGAHAKDLNALLSHLGIGEAHFVVNSRGGAIIMQFLRLNSEKVRSLVFADATIALAELSDVFRAAAARYREPPPSRQVALRQREARKQSPFYEVARSMPEVRAVLERMIDQHSLRIALSPERALDLASPADVGPWNERDFPDMVKRAKPVLLLVGERTDPFFIEGAEKAHRLWPRARYRVIAGSDHLLMLESPEEFNRLTLDFLGEVDLEGLWRYRSIARQGAAEVPIDGLFLFRDNRFVQQSLNEGEPFERQLAQAHAGSYRMEEGKLRLVSEVGLVVDPTRHPPLDDRGATAHEAVTRRSGSVLTLTFATGTVQKLERVGPGQGTIVPFDRGALALVDGHFLLAAQTADRAVAASGSFERRDGRLRLEAKRWFSIESGNPTYRRNQVVEALLGDNALTFPDGLRLPFSR